MNPELWITEHLADWGVPEKYRAATISTLTAPIKGALIKAGAVALAKEGKLPPAGLGLCGAEGLQVGIAALVHSALTCRLALSPAILTSLRTERFRFGWFNALALMDRMRTRPVNAPETTAALEDLDWLAQVPIALVVNLGGVGVMDRPELAVLAALRARHERGGRTFFASPIPIKDLEARYPGCGLATVAVEVK